MLNNIRKELPKQVKDGESKRRKALVKELLALSPGADGEPDAIGLIHEFRKQVLENALAGELSSHLGYNEGEEPPAEQANRRNGTSTKTLRTEEGPLSIEIPRDRDGSFAPTIVKKHQRDFAGFDDKIISMYGRGMSVRDIQGCLEEMYGVEVSPDLISRATAKVSEDVRTWRLRPLERVYCIVYVDAIVVKVRQEKGPVTNKSAYLAVGVLPDGTREHLGIWIQQSEGASFWAGIFEELRTRGIEDILVLCADGLKGMSEAAEAIFPQAVFQTCIVHVIRSSTRFVSWKHRKEVCADLKAVYNAIDEKLAKEALEAFKDKWDKRYPTVAKSWESRWGEIIPFLAYPKEIRRAIYTTNAIESQNRVVRKTLKTKGHLPNDEAALKLIFLSLINQKKGRISKLRNWHIIINQFAIYFEGRIN